jgi:parallel beta-helix repeat protein
MVRPLLCCLLICVFSTSVVARDIFVSNGSGDDLADGRSARNSGAGSGPVRTIARGLQLADKADRLIIENSGKPYHESISLCTGRHSGYRGKPFTIIGNGAVLDGTAAAPREAWQHFEGDLFRFQPRRLAYQQLHLGDRPPVRKRIGKPGEDLPKLEPLDWMLWGPHVYFRVEPGKIPSDYPLRNSALQTGITVYHVRHVRIANLVVQGFALDGVNVHDGVNDCELVDLTCRGNGRTGISIGGSSRVLVENCLVGDNHEAQIRTEGYCHARVQGTEVVDNTAPAYNVAGGRLEVDGKLMPPGRSE